jgi:protein phosphatase
MNDYNIEEVIKAAFEGANKHVYEMSTSDPELNGMGTTAVVALLHQSHVWICHVGDSRAYVVNKDQLIRITKDHSLVQELLDAGSITEEESMVHPKRNVITQALGAEFPVKPDLTKYQITEHDIILLCTDGLTNMVSREEILAIVTTSSDFNIAAKRLVDVANQKGGKDNVSVILVGTKLCDDLEKQVK